MDIPAPKPSDLPLGATATAHSAWLVRRPRPGRVCAQVVMQQHAGGVFFEPDLGGSDDVTCDSPPHAIPSSIHVDLEGQARPPRRPPFAHSQRHVGPPGANEGLIHDVQNRGTFADRNLIERLVGGRHIGSVPWDGDGGIAADVAPDTAVEIAADIAVDIATDGAAGIPERFPTDSRLLVAQTAVIA